MSYEKFYPNGWQSGETGGTPISPEALNHIENGIKNSAPAGYGLGGRLTIAKTTEIDNLTENRFYVLDNTTANLRFAGVDFNYAFLVVHRSDSYASQEIRPIGKEFCRIYRESNRGVTAWDEWSCENPPMELGVEYRTTERYLGKAVYCKAINFGSLPDNASKQVPHGISGKTDNLRFTIVSRNTSRLLTVSGITDALVDDTNIDIATDRSLSYAAVIFTLWYTKD